MPGIVIKVRNPKPEELDDAMEKFDGDRKDEGKMGEEEPDEDADKAGARSAMADYMKALKANDVDKALEYLKEVMAYCKE